MDATASGATHEKGCQGGYYETVTVRHARQQNLRQEAYLTSSASLYTRGLTSRRRERSWERMGSKAMLYVWARLIGSVSKPKASISIPSEAPPSRLRLSKCVSSFSKHCALSFSPCAQLLRIRYHHPPSSPSPPKNASS